MYDAKLLNRGFAGFGPPGIPPGLCAIGATGRPIIGPSLSCTSGRIPGFGFGYSTFSLLLEEKGLLPNPAQGPEYYIAPLSEKELSASLALAEQLRKRASVEVDLMGRNLGNQMKYADKIGAKKVIVVGENELKSGVFTIKNMKTGKEEKRKRSEF